MKIERPQYLRYADLKLSGLVPFTRKHVRTLVSKGQFPAPLRISANTLLWRTSEIDDWAASRPRGTYAVKFPKPQSYMAMREGRASSTKQRTSKRTA